MSSGGRAHDAHMALLAAQGDNQAPTPHADTKECQWDMTLFFCLELAFRGSISLTMQRFAYNIANHAHGRFNATLCIPKDVLDLFSLGCKQHERRHSNVQHALESVIALFMCRQ